VGAWVGIHIDPVISWIGLPAPGFGAGVEPVSADPVSTEANGAGITDIMIAGAGITLKTDVDDLGSLMPRLRVSHLARHDYRQDGPAASTPRRIDATRERTSGMMARARGELRRAVLRILWDASQPLTSREIQARFAPDPLPALTTVLTVLERLRLTDHVERGTSASGEYTFAATQSESKHVTDEMLEALSRSRDTHATLLRFAGNLDESQVAVLKQALRGRDAGGEPG
jgi:predicted transcriptional regulator